MEHLVANSGIQFIKKEIEFNPAEPLILPSNRPLKYSFCDYADFITGEKVFDFLYYHQRDDMFIPVKEMIASGHLERSLNGRECLDETGLVKLLPNTSSTLYSSFQQGDPGVITMNALDRFRVVNPNGDGREQISAFELLLDKWLPMPMFEKSVDGVTADVPMGWCRLRLQELGDGEVKGNKRYRLVWAFDTDLSEDFLSSLRPCFYDGDGVSKEYCLCNKVDELIRFMSVNSEFSAFADYIASVLGVADRNDSRYRAFYIYFMNFIRFSGGAPEITLHHQKPETDIEVDLVLDIGNSRTCGVLFEECQFTKAEMLQLRDLSRPWVVDKNTIDMRLVFRKADLGNDIVLNEDLFSWKSFVRVGEEAKRLVYRSLEDEGLAGKTTNYSSPKRYLWDEKAYCGRWENLTTVDDPFNVRLSDNIFIPGLSPLFDNQGKFNPNPDPLAGLAGSDTHYSRSSLMTFVFIELLQQALMQINSIGFRTHWGKINFRRKLRNIIITCPTAMPKKEQIKLRECAVDAAKALSKCNVLTNAVNIVPSPESLNVKDDDMDVPRVWSFDEASCCQLVYLYAEIKQRYDGEVHKFFEMKGHVRPELKVRL